MFKHFIILNGLLLFLVVGTLIDNSNYFIGLKQGLQERTIPSPLLNFGKRGQIMKLLGLKFVPPSNEPSYNIKNDFLFKKTNAVNINLKKLTYKKDWAKAKDLHPEKMPSSLVINDNLTKSGLPILSITIDDLYLNDQHIGIFKNPLKTGRNWERPCFVSYYENGILQFATGAGLRVHGGKSRLDEIKSLRLYFRDTYGESQFKPGLIFGSKSDPLTHIVLRRDSAGGTYFSSSLPYDISRKIGCYAPETKPVNLYINGSAHGNGMFNFTEHLSYDYLKSHFGHDNFVFVRSKQNKFKKIMPEEYQELLRWARDKNNKITIENVNQRFDVENLSRWWISQLYCGNTDIFQGLIVLDKTKEKKRWFIVNWDMDHSIYSIGNIYKSKLNNSWEQEKKLLNNLNKRWRDPRAIFFSRLLKDDPYFIKYFEDLLMKSLNHNVTPDYIKTTIDNYEKTLESFKIKDQKFINKTRYFFRHRPAYMRKLMKVFFGSPDSYKCKVVVPIGFKYKIDGFDAMEGYEGWYFKGATIIVKSIESSKGVSHWMVNGERHESVNNELKYTIKGEAVITPVFILN
jgi:CotH kinase protein